jgi:hypothetical protein
MPRIKRVSLARHLLFLPVAVAAFAIGYVSLEGTSAETTVGGRADPTTFLPGERNEAAVQDATSFSDYPIVWLGTEFGEFQLTEFIHTEYDLSPEESGHTNHLRRNSVGLVYGTCQPVDPGDGHPSCVPPLSILIWAPGMAPRPNEVEPGMAGPVGDDRGVISREVSTGTMLGLTTASRSPFTGIGR